MTKTCGVPTLSPFGARPRVQVKPCLLPLSSSIPLPLKILIPSKVCDCLLVNLRENRLSMITNTFLASLALLFPRILDMAHC